MAFAIVFDTFPRSRISELEKRELATFPKYSVDKLKSGSFTSEISSWFSDSEPFRDDFMTLSMNIKDYLGLAASDDQVTFHASSVPMESSKQSVKSKSIDQDENRVVGEYENDITADENAKIANAGIR